MKLKIAVISDLHCHDQKKNGELKESYLVTDRPIPENQNPLLSLEELITDSKEDGLRLEADILIMPGDITNKCDNDGFEFGWKVTKEVGRLLNVKIIIPTVGNHDVDSRKKFSHDPFYFIRNLSEDFPFSDEFRAEFWRDGFSFIEDDLFRIVVINSAHGHITFEEALHGCISDKALHKMERRLEHFLNKKKYNIAVCHHHPIQHERYGSETHDLIENGSELVALLEKFDFQIIIHGHKHDPMIRYAPGGTNSPVVFSAGSFSAFKTQLLQGAYNTFHIITLDDQIVDQCDNQGTIDTWFFTPPKGWSLDVLTNHFYPKVGFGCRGSVRNIALQILSWMHSQNKQNCAWNELLNQFPMLKFLLPTDKIKLGERLKENNIIVYPSFPQEPELASLKT